MGFVILLKKISPSLRKIAMHYQHYTNFSDADDLYQEMSIYLWNRYKDGVPLGINQSYMIRGCKYHILNLLRKEKISIKLLSLEGFMEAEGRQLESILPNQMEDIDRSIERKFVFNQIRNNGFSKREKEVLEQLIRGCTVREIGTKLGISHVMVVKLKKRLIHKWRGKNKGYQKGKILT